MEIQYLFPTNTAYTLNDGIPQAGGTNFLIRVANYLTFIRFDSEIVGVSGVKIPKADYANADYYAIKIPANATGASRLVQVYGYSARADKGDGVLVIKVYQKG